MILKTNWLPTDYYAPDDLNRVEANTAELATELAAAGYPATLQPIVTDRNCSGYEFADSLSRVESNIHALATAFMSPPGYQVPKTWAPGMRHSYIDANRVEQNLQLIYDWLVRAVASFKRCGTFACGEDGGIY